MKRRALLSVVMCVSLAAGPALWAETLKLAAPSALPNTVSKMKSPGFWIGRHPFPDRTIMDRRAIDMFNDNIVTRLKLVTDPLKLGPVYDGDELKKQLEADVKALSAKGLYSAEGRKFGAGTFKGLRDNMSIDLIYKKCVVLYGVVTATADQRILPTDDIMTEKPLDADFDELQNNSLDVGTPLAILHQSADGKWLYAAAPSSWGWVKKESVALCFEDNIRDLRDQRPFAIVTSAKADVYLDRELKIYYERVRMGTKFLCNDKVERGIVMVKVPYRNEGGKLTFMTGFIKREDVSFGYLPYTPRSIIDQAFKLLNEPYGWGGRDGEQDCSSLVQEIFSTVGIMMPRNSSAQGQVGFLMAEFSDKGSNAVKLDAIARDGIGGVTTLQMKGHILLFLGMYANKPFAMHATYGYSQKTAMGYADRVLNKVVVSDLSLGSGGQKGSLLDRLTTVRIVADNDLKK